MSSLSARADAAGTAAAVPCAQQMALQPQRAGSARPTPRPNQPTNQPTSCEHEELQGWENKIKRPQLGLLEREQLSPHSSLGAGGRGQHPDVDTTTPVYAHSVHTHTYLHVLNTYLKMCLYMIYIKHIKSKHLFLGVQQTKAPVENENPALSLKLDCLAKQKTMRHK